jgi:hypothetical protein
MTPGGPPWCTCGALPVTYPPPVKAEMYVSPHDDGLNASAMRSKGSDQPRPNPAPARWTVTHYMGCGRIGTTPATGKRCHRLTNPDCNRRNPADRAIPPIAAMRACGHCASATLRDKMVASGQTLMALTAQLPWAAHTL